VAPAPGEGSTLAQPLLL